jgi:DNA-nicking Smr family endonuclease
VKRPLRPEEIHIWARVAATVRPAPGKRAPDAPLTPPADPGLAAVAQSSVARPAPTVQRKAPAAPDAIEPRRRERLTRGRDPLGPRLDLHGMSQDRARAVLADFLARAVGDGWRAVLVITGKGVRGDGVLRRRVPEWLAEPGLRPLVAGVSEAHRRHGGEGALYVALKRRTAN